MTATKPKFDMYQFRDKRGRKFGYVRTAEKADGGYFFTWMPTMAETLDSLDADEIEKPNFDESLAREFLESKIASKFAGSVAANSLTSRELIAAMEALEAAAKWMDFVAAKLDDPEDLDRNIRKYGARKWVKQFGQGAKYRAAEARAAIAKVHGGNVYANGDDLPALPGPQ